MACRLAHGTVPFARRFRRHGHRCGRDQALAHRRLQAAAGAFVEPVCLGERVVNGLYESTAATAMTPLMGTPFMAPCLRLMGCKVGRWVFLETTLFSEFDLVEIGDHAALNMGVTVQTHLFEDRVMKADRLKISEHCSIGNMSVVLYGTEMQKGSSLGPLSLLMKGETLPPASHWHGIPTELIGAGRKPPAQTPIAEAA